jgi:spore coat protein A
VRNPRRRFLQNGGVLAAAFIAGGTTHGSPGRRVFTVCRASGATNVASAAEKEIRARPQLDPDKLEPFVDALPRPTVAKADDYRPSPEDPAIKLPYYRMPIRAMEIQVHRDLRPTYVWGYGTSSPGPTLETRSGRGLLVEWVNELPREHFLPIDHSLHGAGADQPEVRAVTHVHGARVPPESDGYPEHWTVPGNSVLCHYPSRQDAATLWYHDHAMGINRLNVYAGLYGLFIVRDRLEDSLNLPTGAYEIPLLLCDRMFDQQSQLYYPLSQTPGTRWMPELYGDATLVNGKLFPYLAVEARKYRFRILNAANSRFYYLSLSNGQPLHQIGSDQGLLPAPVPVTTLALAPGERADLIVDFGTARNQTVLLKNDAISVVQFRVSADAAPDASAIPKTLRRLSRTPESESVKTRLLTLDENRDPRGNSIGMLLNGARWGAPVSETAVIDTTETWSLINLTDDIHPIHLHLVRFQILDRRKFDRFAYRNGQGLRYKGPPIAPEPNEAGWKDTVRADPGLVTRISVRFEGFVGRYVWHCHIVEHEDNEMMRPYEVVAPPGG